MSGIYFSICGFIFIIIFISEELCLAVNGVLKLFQKKVTGKTREKVYCRKIIDKATRLVYN